MVLRVYLSKIKRLIKIHNHAKEINNIDNAISTYKPPMGKNKIFQKTDENLE